MTDLNPSQSQLTDLPYDLLLYILDFLEEWNDIVSASQVDKGLSSIMKDRTRNNGLTSTREFQVFSLPSEPVLFATNVTANIELGESAFFLSPKRKEEKSSQKNILHEIYHEKRERKDVAIPDFDKELRMLFPNVEDNFLKLTLRNETVEGFKALGPDYYGWFPKRELFTKESLSFLKAIRFHLSVRKYNHFGKRTVEYFESTVPFELLNGLKKLESIDIFYSSFSSPNMAHLELSDLPALRTCDFKYCDFEIFLDVENLRKLRAKNCEFIALRKWNERLEEVDLHHSGGNLDIHIAGYLDAKVFISTKNPQPSHSQQQLLHLQRHYGHTSNKHDKPVKISIPPKKNLKILRLGNGSIVEKVGYSPRLRHLRTNNISEKISANSIVEKFSNCPIEKLWIIITAVETETVDLNLVSLKDFKKLQEVHFGSRSGRSLYKPFKCDIQIDGGGQSVLERVTVKREFQELNLRLTNHPKLERVQRYGSDTSITSILHISDCPALSSLDLTARGCLKSVHLVNLAGCKELKFGVDVASAEHLKIENIGAEKVQVVYTRCNEEIKNRLELTSTMFPYVKELEIIDRNPMNPRKYRCVMKIRKLKDLRSLERIFVRGKRHTIEPIFVEEEGLETSFIQVTAEYQKIETVFVQKSRWRGKKRGGRRRGYYEKRYSWEEKTMSLDLYGRECLGWGK